MRRKLTWFDFHKDWLFAAIDSKPPEQDDDSEEKKGCDGGMVMKMNEIEEREREGMNNIGISLNLGNYNYGS